jgi:molecular chaperone DnaJ
MATKRDYYEILGVSRSADDREIKKAYRKIAMESHPDRNPGDAKAEETFKEAAEAYGVLSDADKKAAYDRYGHDAFRQGGGPNIDPNDIFSSFSDIFAEMFGGGGGRSRDPNAPSRGEDLQLTLRVPFEFAVHGGSEPVTIPRTRTCKTCDGNGARPGTSPAKCTACGGRGQVILQQGLFRVQTTCNRCRGRGVVIEHPCTTCHGSGEEKYSDKVTIKVPAGVETGTRLRMSGQGNGGRRGGESGDLYIVLQVEPSDLFERDGADLHLPCEVDFTQAALGGTVAIPTTEGTREVPIAPGTQHGDRYTLRGAGLKRVNRDSRGDLVVHFQLRVPKELTERQRELLRQLAEENGVEVARHHEGFFARLAKMFSPSADS